MWKPYLEKVNSPLLILSSLNSENVWTLQAKQMFSGFSTKTRTSVNGFPCADPAVRARTHPTRASVQLSLETWFKWKSNIKMKPSDIKCWNLILKQTYIRWRWNITMKVFEVKCWNAILISNRPIRYNHIWNNSAHIYSWYHSLGLIWCTTTQVPPPQLPSFTKWLQYNIKIIQLKITRIV